MRLPMQEQRILASLFCEMYINYNIKSVFIPKNVNSIGVTVWGNTNSELTEYVVHPENQKYTSEDGVLYTKDKKTLVSCPVRKPGVYTVPEGVVTLAEHAFDSSKTGVILPSTLRTIGDGAFLFFGILQFNRFVTFYMRGFARKGTRND